jgi:glyoxylase-like metal-dependent hydrolase (beta-lactamase superfamily II)
MVRKIVIGIGVLIVAVIAFVAVGLSWAHLAIDRERAPLPDRMTLTLAAAMYKDLPVRLSVLNTASQPMPRSAVLDPSKDPKPNEPYVMSHPSFVLEWADGRILLIDTGMTRQGALDFGRPLEWLGGAAPMQPHGSAASRLGDARQRVQGVVFTHLHLDHVGGITEVCEGLGHPVRVFMTDAQAERPNFTTRPGLKLLRQTSCVQEVRLKGNRLLPVPGFDGVFVIAAGGHTPGSQMVVAVVATPEQAHGYIFTGDIVNNIDGVNDNIPKPFLYSLLMVPEDAQRLTELRRYLKNLRDGNNFTLLVSHDQIALQQSGVPAWVQATP